MINWSQNNTERIALIFEESDGVTMMETKRERFLSQYDKCIDNRGQVKLCGRDACKDLILAALQVEPAGNFGSVTTGFMNVQNLILLHERLA